MATLRNSIIWGASSMAFIAAAALGAIIVRESVSAQGATPLLEPPRYEKICAAGEDFCTHWKIYQRY